MKKQNKNTSHTLNDSGLYFEECKIFKLTSYQISKITIKELNWFNIKDNEGLIFLIVYNLADNSCNIISPSTKKHKEYLCSLQQNGYRFMHHSHEEYNRFKDLHPLCDKCLRKNSCPFIKASYELRLIYMNLCYTPIPDSRVDAMLLTLPYFIPS